MKLCVGLIFFVSLLACIAVQAQNRKPLIQKEPAWVTRTSFDYNKTQMDDEATDGYIDLVHEKQVNLQEQAVYRKVAIKYLSETGVQNRSEVNISYDPYYSKLLIHTISIIRGKEIINKLDAGKIKVIQQENELNRFLYDGSLSAILFLEDVRKGDILEYSYTKAGFNPVFKGRYSGIFETAFSDPVYHMYFKLLAPDHRTVQIKNSLTDVAYTRSKAGGQTVYEWTLKDVPGVRLQDYTPSWHDPFPMVMVSEYSNWKDVVNWARELYPFDGKLSPGLMAKIKEFSAGKKPEDRIRAALRFVQDDVRYMGIEMAEGSHKPNRPDKVFQQRFGDCKDKSYLLCTMLRSMGIEAHPVLINTNFRKTIMSWLPSPFAFNHVTVRVLCNGRYYYFDPTISYQRGAIDSIAFPNYECGLVITDSTTALTAIPLQDKGMVKVRETFDIPNMSGQARLKVRTEYTGSFADDVRDDFNSDSKTSISEGYLEFYRRYFDKIEADSLTVTDDEETGQLVVNEYYSINDFWTLKEGVVKCYFSPYVIYSVMKRPKDKKRKMPIRINYPARYKEEIIINVPEEWSGDEITETVDCAAFTMNARFTYGYKQFLLKYDYETKKSQVSPEESEEYFSKLETVDNKMDYMLSDNSNATVNKDAEGRGNRLAYLTLGVLGIIGVAIWWTQRRR